MYIDDRDLQAFLIESKKPNNHMMDSSMMNSELINKDSMTGSNIIPRTTSNFDTHIMQKDKYTDQ